MPMRKNASLFRQAGELPDYEEPEWDGEHDTSDWLTCKIHGDYPREAQESIWYWLDNYGDYGGMVPILMCPICYNNQMNPDSWFWKNWRAFYESSLSKGERT